MEKGVRRSHNRCDFGAVEVSNIVIPTRPCPSDQRNVKALCHATTWLRSAALEAGCLVLIVVRVAHGAQPVARFEVLGPHCVTAITVLPGSMTLEACNLVSEIVGATELQETFVVYVRARRLKRVRASVHVPKKSTTLDMQLCTHWVGYFNV